MQISANYGPVVLDNILHIMFLGITTGFIWMVKRTFIEPAKETREQLIKHVEECNKIPKQIILNEINNVSKLMKEQKTEIKEIGNKVMNLSIDVAKIAVRVENQ